MQIVVVLAHPNPDSFTHAVAERACAGLLAAGHEVKLLDLYALGFRAAMSLQEHVAYHGDQPNPPAAAQHPTHRRHHHARLHEVRQRPRG